MAIYPAVTLGDETKRIFAAANYSLGLAICPPSSERAFGSLFAQRRNFIAARLQLHVRRIGVGFCDWTALHT